MSALILPSKFTQQPQYPAPIDKNGLGGRARFALLGGQSYELVNGVIRAGTLGTNTITADGTAYVLPSANTTWTKRVDAIDPYVSGSFSVFWRGVIRYDTLQTLLSYGSVSVGWEFKTDGWAPGQIRLRLDRVFYGAGPATGAISVADGSIHSVAVVYDDAAATVEFFWDGLSAGSAGFTKDPGAVGSTGFFAMKGDATSPHKMLTAQVFSGKLSQAEIRSLRDSKGLSIFKAPVRRLWVVSASGITLVGANSTEANTSGTGAITQAHALAGSNSTQANTSLSAAVTQTHALAGANSTQANTAGTGAITQGAQLTGANSAQANTASASAITQTHVLAVANCSQGNAASTGSIAGGVNLAAASAAQANAGGTGAITQAHVLVHAPSVQDNIAATSAIVQAHVLAASNGSQGNASSAGSIIIGSAEITSVVEKTAVFRATVSRATKFQRSKSVTVRLN